MDSEVSLPLARDQTKKSFFISFHHLSYVIDNYVRANVRFRTFANIPDLLKFCKDVYAFDYRQTRKKLHFSTIMGFQCSLSRHTIMKEMGDNKAYQLNAPSTYLMHKAQRTLEFGGGGEGREMCVGWGKLHFTLLSNRKKPYNCSSLSHFR